MWTTITKAKNNLIITGKGKSDENGQTKLFVGLQVLGIDFKIEGLQKIKIVPSKLPLIVDESALYLTPIE